MGRQAIFADNGKPAEGGDRAGIHLATVPAITAAGDIGPAPLDPREDDPVALADFRHAGPDFADDAAAFVPETMRQKGIVATVALRFEQLRVAHAAVLNLDEHLSRLQWRDLDVIHDERATSFDQNRGRCLHDGSSIFPFTPRGAGPAASREECVRRFGRR